MPKPPSKKSAIATTSAEYTEGATIHGVRYIFDNSLPSIDRIFWAVFVFIFFILTIYFTMTSYSDWQANLVITTLKNTAKDVLIEVSGYVVGSAPDVQKMKP